MMSVVSLFLFFRIVCSQDLNLDTTSMFGSNDIQNNVVGSIVQAIMSQSNDPIQASGMTVEKSEIHVKTDGDSDEQQQKQQKIIQHKKKHLKQLRKINKNLSQRILALTNADSQIHFKLTKFEKKNQTQKLTPQQQKEEAARKEKVKELADEVNGIHDSLLKNHEQIDDEVKQEKAEEKSLKQKKDKLDQLHNEYMIKMKQLSGLHNDLSDNIKEIGDLNSKLNGVDPVLKNLHASLVAVTKMYPDPDKDKKTPSNQKSSDKKESTTTTTTSAKTTAETKKTVEVKTTTTKKDTTKKGATEEETTPPGTMKVETKKK